MKTVLHIAAHMGGGVGKVLSNVTLAKNREYDHHIVLLEKPIDTVFTEKLDELQLTITPSIGLLIELIGEADIVQFDWWNHPLLAGVMHDVQNIPMRSVVWSHTAGNYYPHIKPGFVGLPDHFIFSSQYSRDNKFWTLPDAANMQNTSVINSSGGFKDTKDVKLEKHEGFNVGYIGTLGYIKLNPDFIEYCIGIADIPGIKFVMIGRIPEPNLLMRDAKRAGLADKFVFTGYVKDLPAELAKLDVIGYLLNPNHFGTTENAMLEAMSMGIPPIVLNQCAEKYLIKNGYSGYVVNNYAGYELQVKAMYQYPALRHSVGKNARDFVLTHLELRQTVERLNDVYRKVMQNSKQRIKFDEIIGKTPYDWYQSGLPPQGNKNISQYLVDSSKGSAAQWAKYYPKDDKLQALVVK